MRFFLLVSIAVCLHMFSFGQQNGFIDMAGKWSVCISIGEDSCVGTPTLYTFSENGTFQQSKNVNGVESVTAGGRWLLEEDILYLFYNKARDRQGWSIKYALKKENARLLYDISTEGDAEVYTWFRRLGP